MQSQQDKQRLKRKMRNLNSLTKIKSRWASKCAETGKAIKKGEEMFYDYSTKKCYCLASVAATEQTTGSNDFVQDPGEQYFDNFCMYNNI